MYDDIYDDELDEYEEFDENESMEDAIERLKGTIASGDCIYCGGRNTMEYEGNICFICSKCGRSIHENLYYIWAAGFDVELDSY